MKWVFADRTGKFSFFAMVNPSVNSHPSAATPHAWLFRAANLCFPANRSLATLVLPSDLDEAWSLVASVAGVSARELADRVALHSGLERAVDSPLNPELAKLLPEPIARRLEVTPWSMTLDGGLVIAASEPKDAQTLQELRFVTGGRVVELRLAPPEDVEVVRVSLYGAAPATHGKHNLHVLDLDDDGLEVSLGEDAKLVHFCRALIRQAIERRASDIHIHPLASAGVVRFRIDGHLIRAASISLTVMTALIRLFKVQGRMDSTNAMVPQDGRASLRWKQRQYDLRISTLPASGAEALVVRLLDQSRTFDLSKTNFAPWALDALRRLTSNANGLILLAGPTGCGKTSTLYSLLASLNKSTRRVITVEDPVEYQLQGLTQVEVNNSAGVTFQRALRSVLRQDPDILLIGEIRDAETAEIAVQAALTGHLVFSTLHTQDALRAIPRLQELGVPPELLADTLLGVVSQRLMRQLCPHCKTACAEPLQPIEGLFERVTGARPGARAVGCEHCSYTGYYGRFPVVEALEIPDAMRSKLLRGQCDAESLASTVPAHWRSIETNAANWVTSGFTTAAEAYDCIGLRLWTKLASRAGVEAPVGEFLGGDADEASASAVSPTVLIVSPQATLPEALSARLTTLGETGLVVATPAEALRALQREHHLHLLIIDITQIDTPLRAYAEELRASLAWSGLRTLVLYDGSDDGVVKRIEDFGLHAHMPVPIDGEAFDSQVRHLITRG